MKIGDLARRSGLSVHTIRYYERIGLLPRADRDASGHRDYDAAILTWIGFLDRIKARAPSLDLIGVQLYGDIEGMQGRLRDAGWTGAYVVTEWGPTGHWESPETAWGAPIEDDASRKAALLAERDPFARIAGTGLACAFGVQALINMGVAVRLLPAKGMTLPLISYGGSSMLAMGLTMGFALALTRRRPGAYEPGASLTLGRRLL